MVTAPVADDQVPGRQFVQAEDAGDPDHLPAGQTMHSPMALAPIVERYVPARHACDRPRIVSVK